MRGLGETGSASSSTTQQAKDEAVDRHSEMRESRDSPVRVRDRGHPRTLDGLANFAAAVLLDSKLLLERSTRKIWEGRPRSSAPKLERGSFGRTGRVA